MSEIHRAALALVLLSALAPAQSLPLSGEWRFALDPNNQGLAQAWHTRRLDGSIALPGTTDEARKTPANPARLPDRLTRRHPYLGPAWYQRDIDIPANWAGQRVTLFLERTKSSRLWLDAQPLGANDSLVAPHEYVLPNLQPGRHTLTLRLDNADHAPIGDPHQITDHTQTNWNGIVGRIELRATPPIWLDDIQIYPDPTARRLRIQATLGNQTGQSAHARLTLSPCAATREVDVPTSTLTLDLDCAVPADTKPWDEFAPALSQLTVQLEAGPHHHSRTLTYGLRSFRAAGTQFALNGRPVFLRGKVDNCVFPLTGYPAMDAAEWRRLFLIAREYGINHYRFHSWCPPEAAFEAADQLGFFLQPELPNWAAFGNQRHDGFLREEGRRLLRAYGNHPSFVMLSLGNEIGGNPAGRKPFIDLFRQLDPRHLYAQGTNNWVKNYQDGDDYWASFQVNGRHIRGSFATTDLPLGHIQTGPPNTLKDYLDEISAVRVPVVSHEIAEFQVYPDFREMPKYTGVLAPRNFELARERLEAHHMLDQADAFTQASGRLTAICYREDIEAALRTRGMAGFQLLDLQDFPGQGTALVGILNAFMESKGLIEPAQWRRFCSETVPLLRFSKYTFTTADTVNVSAEAAHFGPTALDAQPRWTLRASDGKLLAEGTLPRRGLPTGANTALGSFTINLASAPAPARLRLELTLEGTPHRNAYDLWVYPTAVPPSSVTLRRTWDDETRRLLAAGQSVLLIPDPKSLPASIEGRWAPDFWNYGMFKGFAIQRKLPVAPGTLGLLTDPAHPALAAFPTESHSNWQWFHLAQNSRALILDTLPPSFRPIVQVIDNFERAHRLGVIFEARIGPGRLLVCAMDLPAHQDKPEARQLLHSLTAYMESPRFQPAAALAPEALSAVLR